MEIEEPFIKGCRTCDYTLVEQSSQYMNDVSIVTKGLRLVCKAITTGNTAFIYGQPFQDALEIIRLIVRKYTLDLTETFVWACEYSVPQVIRILIDRVDENILTQGIKHAVNWDILLIVRTELSYRRRQRIQHDYM